MEENDPFSVNVIPIVFTMMLFMGMYGSAGAMSLLVGVVFYQWKTKKKLKFSRWVLVPCFLIYLWLSIYTLSHLAPECFISNGVGARQQIDCNMLINLTAAANGALWPRP